MHTNLRQVLAVEIKCWEDFVLYNSVTMAQFLSALTIAGMHIHDMRDEVAMNANFEGLLKDIQSQWQKNSNKERKQVSHCCLCKTCAILWKQAKMVVENIACQCEAEISLQVHWNVSEHVVVNTSRFAITYRGMLKTICS